MCFSATASFALAGVLVPAGIFTIAKIDRGHSAWLPLAAFPLVFGIQQGIEGAVWLGVDGGRQALVETAGRGFLFFSHFFWLVWVPFAVWRLESDPVRRRFAAALVAAGALFGLSLFLPPVLVRDWLAVERVNLSLDYRTTLIYDGVVSRLVLQMAYAAIVVGALALSSDRRIRLFGALVAVSLAAAYVFFAYAYISVWCFFAAILSVYMTVVIQRDRRAAQGPDMRGMAGAEQ